MPYLKPDDFDAVFTAMSELLDRQHLDLHPDDRAMLAEAHAHMNAAKGRIASDGQRDRAREEYGTDEIEIDDAGAATSEGDGGTWVQAWVWLADAEDEDSGACRADDCDGDPSNGEGYNGYCGNCADRLDRDEDENEEAPLDTPSLDDSFHAHEMDIGA